ncbi:hypothetical protein [Cobetia sp. L2A1]|uniref:hypothetical protein n=1 Tax=Cobetia sp. L2A1 TaxID=2686360 RepID=UPI00131B1364|nr:hypothetical protein [Cobetia sp. L2A1]
MTLMKTALAGLAMLLMTGCASRAQIDVPVVQPVQTQAYEHKAFFPDIYYSQPEANLFSGAAQQAMQPLGNVRLSHVCSPAMTNFDQLLREQLPSTSSITHDARAGDYRLQVEIMAHENRGPVYLDYLMAINLPMNLLTFGIANEDFDIIADFNVEYRLYDKDEKLLFSKDYTVRDSVPHQAGNFDIGNRIFLPAQNMMTKYLLLTMNDFFNNASRPLPATGT